MTSLFFQDGRRRLGDGEAPLRKAIRWVRANRLPGGGIRVDHKAQIASREVTGYLIDSLYRAGEKSLAFELARWEAREQEPDGSFAAPDGVPYTFDTAQVVRGFLAVLEELPELEGNLRRACDYVAGQIGPDGRVDTLSYEMWSLPDGTRFSEYTNLYVLPPLRAAGTRLSEPRYVELADRGMEYFRRKPDLVEFKPELGTLSHIFGYMMEALVELGEFELARAGLAQAAAIQRADGAIPAFPGAEWVCSTGMAQLCIAWYRLGETGPADRALDYLKRIQNRSGGFFGSYGPGASYLPAVEISWGAKFFIDALLLSEGQTSRAVAQRAATAGVAASGGMAGVGTEKIAKGNTPWNLTPNQWSDKLLSETTVSDAAARLQERDLFAWSSIILELTRRGDRVLDLGSGRGENPAALEMEGRETTAVDWSFDNLRFSDALFRKLETKGRFCQADITRPLPFKDGSFDLVYSCGVFEYFQDYEIEAILREAFRVARRTVAIMVPNALSVPYRFGMWYMKKTGKWDWGGEVPSVSLKPRFHALGVREVLEYSVSPRLSLNFLVMPGGSRAKQMLLGLFGGRDSTRPTPLRQGYLLVTVGTKPDAPWSPETPP